jgi:tetratricopeptide (TPR) repeat protein
MWESTAVTVLALAAVGVAAARLGDRPLRLGLSGRAPIALACAGAGILQLPGILSTRAIDHSQAAARAGNPALALAWAGDAVHAEPWSASAYQQRGLVLESIGRLGPAAADLHAAISREPQSYEHWVVLARIETERGRLAAAVRDYDRAHQLGPHARVFAALPAPAPRR